MRFLLTIMAMALLAISVGCDKPAETAKETPAATTAETEAPAATGATGETQTVSLKLPGMT